MMLITFGIMNLKKLIKLELAILTDITGPTNKVELYTLKELET